MMAKESITLITQDHEFSGENCAHCHQKLQVGNEVVVCPRCKAPHHVQCWIENAGCTTRGCPQVAEVVRQKQASDEELGDNKYLAKERPKRKWKIGLGIVVAVALLAVMLIPGPDPAAGRTKIVLMTQGGVMETNFFETMAEEFNAINPDLYLESMVTPISGYDQKLAVLIGARQAPDIFVTDKERYKWFAEGGGLVSLNQYLEQDPKLKAKLFPEGNTEAVTIDGEIYGIPHPFRSEIFSIYALTENRDTAWQALVTTLERIQADWPEELRTRPQERQGSMPFVPGPMGF